MKKLLIISPEYTRAHSGVAAYLRRLTPELSKYMHVDVLTTIDKEKSFIKENQNLSIYKSIKEWDIFDFKEIMSFISKNNYDFINVQYVPHMYGWNGINFSLPLFYLWAWLKRQNIFTYCHEIALPFSFRYWYWLPFSIFNRLVYISMALFNKTVGLSVRKWKDKSANVFFWMKEKFIVIPVFSNFKTAKISDAEKRKIEEQFNIAKSEKILFFLGGVHPSKLIDYVLFGLEALLKKGYKVKLVCAGFQTERVFDFLKQGQQHLKDYIIKTGIISEKILAQLLYAADIYLCPYADGLSTRRTSAMAGMQLGRPLVSTYGENTDMQLFTKESPLLLAHSKEEFLKNIEFLLNDEGKREELGKKVQQFYENNFSLDIVADYYINVFLKDR